MLFICMFIQWTWGIFQNILGGILFLRYRRKAHVRYRNSVITTWRFDSSVSLGMFIFITDKPYYHKNSTYLRTKEEATERLIVHEYGHTIQSMLLGPFYLFVIGLPSVLWCNLPGMEQRRTKEKISYYSFYTERWANHLGEKITKSGSMRA